MKLINPYIEDSKLLAYCLNFEHAEGKHKALLFEAMLGITSQNYRVLKQAILQATKEKEAVFSKTISFGNLYYLDFELINEQKKAMVRSTWIVPTNEQTARLTSCYILR